MNKNLKLAISAWVGAMIGLGMVFLGLEIFGKIIIYFSIAITIYAVLKGIKSFLNRES